MECDNREEAIMKTYGETDAQINTQAFEWLVELEDMKIDPLAPYYDGDARIQTFAGWFLRSERHQDAFVEAIAMSAVSRRFDPRYRVNVAALQSQPENNNIVPFPGEHPGARFPAGRRDTHAWLGIEDVTVPGADLSER
jgi:hypothetical protein